MTSTPFGTHSGFVGLALGVVGSAVLETIEVIEFAKHSITDIWEPFSACKPHWQSIPNCITHFNDNIMTSLIFHTGVLIGLPIVTVFLVRQHYLRHKGGTPRPEPQISDAVTQPGNPAPVSSSSVTNIGQITIVNSVVIVSRSKSGRLSAPKEILQLVKQANLKPRSGTSLPIKKSNRKSRGMISA